jgi:hypothetical protein
MTEYENTHRIALARELTAAAGVPLRDRYGFAVADQTVLAVLGYVFAEPDDAKAAEDIGLANYVREDGDELELAMGYDTPTDEEYELAIVKALRPLVEQRRDAAVRGLS